jgi:hypothetical protein
MSKDLLKVLSADPIPEDIREGKNKKGETYKYLPISVVQTMLDKIFECNWSFDMDREIFGKGAVSAKGVLTVNWRNEVIITRAGTAALKYGDELKLDYPHVAARVLMNAAKSLGVCFGRDLNRDQEDILEPENEEKIDEEYEMIKRVLHECVIYDTASEILNKSAYKFVPELREIVNSKIRK